jgi:hypothetical protein
MPLLAVRGNQMRTSNHTIEELRAMGTAEKLAIVNQLWREHRLEVFRRLAARPHLTEACIREMFIRPAHRSSAREAEISERGRERLAGLNGPQ